VPPPVRKPSRLFLLLVLMDRSPSQVVADAVQAARAAAVAAAEARCVAIIAEKEAKAAVECAAIAVDKVEAVNVASNVVCIIKLI
jgi:hypothetical protein